MVPKSNFKERVQPRDEFLSAYASIRKTSGKMRDGNFDAAAEGVFDVLATMRFLVGCYSRYEFALKHITYDDVVMDIPCGEGYGSALLARMAMHVYGIDRDSRTIKAARDRYGYPNLTFIEGDMIGGKFPVVDVVVCYEGLEHIADGAAFMNGIMEVINKDRGLIIVSVPVNELFITDGVQNPYHLSDYSPDELEAFLLDYCHDVTLFGTDMMGSVSSVENAVASIIAVGEV